MASGHHLRASADMGAYSATSPLDRRGIRLPRRCTTINSHKVPAAPTQKRWQNVRHSNGLRTLINTRPHLRTWLAATLDQDFKDELSAIEQWFRVLSEPERTAALYALLQQTTQVQIRFFIQVLPADGQDQPMSGVLSPAAFGEKDPLSSRMTTL
ncbi:unnamed protein product [Zymoseptoria tritici ST99CH_1E4]|uniref:RNA-binding protein vts1-like alpha-helical domain-containing protein n=1 Tax=Zymoseptoria tritici ST99CH_1E4 TaxID=1276532 RepID=A0A2H1H3X6_ZYMTR|nr:unnamed protein product [Zymoseptoria tritici ST99CH_1E4]